MPTDLVVYGTQGSPFVRKVLVTMDEKGLPWTLEEVNVFDPPDWFVPLSPARRIPTTLAARTRAGFPSTTVKGWMSCVMRVSPPT